MTTKRYCRHCDEELDERGREGCPNGDIEYRHFCDFCGEVIEEERYYHQIPPYPCPEDQIDHGGIDYVEAHCSCYLKAVAPFWKALGVDSWESFNKWRYR